MKKTAGLILCLVLLTGCFGNNKALERAMGLRAKLLSGGCSFDAQIVADYGDQVYSFSVSCTGDSAGAVTFRVTAPETIAGITGEISGGTGKLIFDETALQFPLLADGQVTPVSVPWLLLKTLQGGYLTSAGIEGEQIRVTIDDTYEEDALQLDIWLGADDLPVQAEVLYDGRRILTVHVSNFNFL